MIEYAKAKVDTRSLSTNAVRPESNELLVVGVYGSTDELLFI